MSNCVHSSKPLESGPQPLSLTLVKTLVALTPKECLCWELPGSSTGGQGRNSPSPGRLLSPPPAPSENPPSATTPGQTRTHTHTEDVKAEALCDRLADQLVREAVEAHVAPQGEAPRLRLCILPREKQQGSEPLGKRGHTGRGHTPQTMPPPLLVCILTKSQDTV